MLKEFRAFVLRGNVVDLAVGVVIGAAFTGVVNALVADLITPLIAAVGGSADFGALTFTVNGSRFAYGHFLNALISFVLVAAVVFFLVVKPMNTLLDRFRPEPKVDAPTRQCPECEFDIPRTANRCAYCSSVVSSPDQ